MPDTDAGQVALELRDVAKSFGSVVALKSGSLSVASGSIHALVGENGAGKSTLVKIVAGVHQRDQVSSASTERTSTSAPPRPPRLPASP